MAYTVKFAKHQATDGNLTQVTITGLDYTGCDLINVFASTFSNFGAGDTLVDSLGNTFVKKDTHTNAFGGGNGGVEVWECRNPTTGTGITLTYTNNAGGARYPALDVFGLAGSLTSAEPQDAIQSSDSGSGTTTSAATPNATPTQNDEIVLAAVGLGGDEPFASVTATLGYTLTTDTGVSSNPNTGAAAYKILSGGSGVAQSCTFTLPSAARVAAYTVTYKVGGGGSGGGVTYPELERIPRGIARGVWH